MLLIKQQDENKIAIKERKIYLCGEYTIDVGCNSIKKQISYNFYKSPQKVKVKAKVKAKISKNK